MTDDKPHLSLVPTDGQDRTLDEPAETPGAEVSVVLSRELQKRYRWAVPFLEAFRNSGNIRASAKVAGVARSTVYLIRDTVSEFAEAMYAAEDDAVDHIDAEVYNRAIPGGDDPMLRHLHKVRMTSQELRRKRLEEARTQIGGAQYRVVVIEAAPAPASAWIGETIDAEYTDAGEAREAEADDAGDDRRSADDAAPTGSSGDGVAGDEDAGTPAEADGRAEDPPETVG